MSDDPRSYFDTYLNPNYQNWRASPLDERLAMNAVLSANHMTAWGLAYWLDRDPNMVYGLSKHSKTGSLPESRYRDELARRECSDLGIVRDVAEAHKHVHLTRPVPKRDVTRSNQTSLGAMGWGEGRFGEGVFGGGQQLVVTLDDGTKRPLTAIMRNVIRMWEQLLARWSL